MKIRKAIFPVGGLGTRFLPATKALPKEMLPVVDKPLIQYAVEEAAAAGVEEFIFVTGRNKSAIEDHFDHSTELESALLIKGKNSALQTVQAMMKPPGSLSYVRQQEPAGLGHAVWCARNLIGREPVAVLLADDLILGEPALKEMCEAWNGGNMVATMNVDSENTSSYGIVTPGEINGNLIEVTGLVEKPNPEDAPSTIAIVGRYIIQPSVFTTLSTQSKGAGGEIQLTDALSSEIGKTPFFGYQFSGTRFDCGSKLGFLQANLAYAFQRDDLKEPLQKWLRELI